MKKGFTLIELLAVIVILAIIALIAVPIVLSIINDSKKSSIERSAELYIDAVEKVIIKENISRKFNPTSCEIKNDGNLLCDEETIQIDMNGKKPTEGTITISNSKIEDFKNLKFDSGYISKWENGKMIVTSTKQEDESGPNMINFTINGISCEAEEGMTWEKFADSEHNTNDIVHTENCMQNNLCEMGATDHGFWDTEDERFVTSSDVIKENGNYIIDEY